MKDIFVVVISIDEVANILGSFASKERAIARANEEITRAQTIYARDSFSSIPLWKPYVYHVANPKKDEVSVVEVQHDEQEDTPA